MESPSLSDPTFKAFLEKLQKQNNQQLATNLLQLKTEREIAGEDDDKREEQLDNINSSLQTINTVVTGYNIEPLATNGENQLEILKKALEELSLIRKISEGSLEYDKASAQYRNTSGRELVSKVSGKEIKKGGFIDFESAADRLTGQGKRVREQNVLNLKPNTTVQPRTLPNQDKPSQEDEKSKFQGFFKELTDGVKFYLTDGLSEKPGYGLFQTPSKEVEKKEREQKISSDRQKVESPINPESDNVTTSQEIVADASKQDLELSKQLLETTKEQLKTLQDIKEALSPKTPAELPSKGLAVEPKEEKEEESKGLSSLASGAIDLLGGGKGIASKAGKGAASLGSKLARFAGSTGGKALGAAAAVGLGAYTAYQGYTGAEEKKQNEIQAIDAKIKAGEITPEQGEQLKKETAAKTTEDKGGAIGKGTGMAAGAIGGGIAGAKVGATIGTFIGGPVGTAIGAGIGTIAGGAIGAISGSSVGQNIGGVIGKGVAGVKSFFGMEDVGEKTKEAVQGKTTSTEIQFSEMTFAKADPDNYKKFVEFRDKRTEELTQKFIESGKFGKSKQAEQIAEKAASMTAKTEAVKKFQKEIEAAGAGKVTTKTENKNEKQQQSTGTPSGDKKPGVSTPQDTSKQRTQAIEQYQTSKQAETAASDKLKEFEKANPFDYREKPTPTQQFLEMPGTGKFSDPKKQAEYDALVNEKEKAYSSKEKAQEQYQKIEGTQREKQLPSGRIQQNIEAPFKKLEALTNRFGYKKEQFLSSDGKTYDMGSINKAYEKEMQKELNTPVDKTKVEAVPKTDKASLVKGQEEKGFLSKAADTAKSVGSSIAGFFGFGKKDEPAPKTGPVEYKDGTKDTLIADEPVVPGKPLSEKQMAVIEMSKSNGNKYSPEIESQFAKQRQASVTPASSSSTGPAVARTSTENADLTREVNKPAPAAQPIVSNNVNTVNTTKYIPSKPTPRPEYTGSALDRHTDRIAFY